MASDCSTDMAIYVIGPVNGHLSRLEQALVDIAFNPLEDKLWFTGNLIGEGPDNLALLNKVKSWGNLAILVLGKHEIDLLSAIAGINPQADEAHFHGVVASYGRDELFQWLRTRPFVYMNSGYLLLHAGIPSEWSFSQTLTFSSEAESSLTTSDPTVFFQQLQAVKQTKWHPKLRGWRRTCFLVNAFTRMSFCAENGRFDFACGTTPSPLPEGHIPWYNQPDGILPKQRILTAYALDSILPVPANILPVQTVTQSDQLTVLRLAEHPERIVFDCRGL